MARRRENVPVTMGLAESGAGVAPDARHLVTALVRGLDVLGCFRSQSLLGNQEIAQQSGLPKSTVSRLTYTLTRQGYLHYAPEIGKYRLGTAFLVLGSATLARLDVRHLAQPLMRDLALFARAAVGLGVRDRLSMVCLELCRGDSAISLNLDVGSRVSLPRSAMGNAFLAVCDPAERGELLREIRDLDEVAWPRLEQRINTVLAQCENVGCACSFGEWDDSVNAIAVGFRPGGGLPPMVLNCGGPAFTTSREFLLGEVRPRLRAIAAQLENSMGI
ncbi:MAG TPA: IclR family transcriptional regulator [Acetobacteraceae bacterium]|nr:IclR family transcriptional regulator [Acetobacteraceae bacterium]